MSTEVFIPVRVIRNKLISRRALATYLAIASFLSKGNGCPSIDEIAQRARYSRRYASEAIRELGNRGLLQTHAKLLVDGAVTRYELPDLVEGGAVA